MVFKISQDAEEKREKEERKAKKYAKFQEFFLAFEVGSDYFRK